MPFGDIWTRVIAAVAAGSGMPDVLVNTVQLFDRAQNDIMTSLQDLAERDNISEGDFWPHAWSQANVDGALYGLPYETDIRVLYYNKAQFADAGLDPETPPADWDALWTAADSLDVIAANGSIERMGFHPLIGNIGLDQWGWCNGGEWQTEDGTPTINAPENVEAMAYSRPGIFNPFYPNMLEVLGPSVDAVLSGSMTPQEAMDDAQHRAEEEITRAQG